MKIITLFISIIILTTTSFAQDNIWVTAQDYLSLRLGPGVHWERLAILDPGITLQAVGRTVNTDWIQVIYDVPLAEGMNDAGTIDGITYGWVARDFLIWSGNILLLPTDGVNTVSMSRRTGQELWLEPDIDVYARTGDFFNPIQGLVAESTMVELTGRIGSFENGYFWLQIELNNQYYWVPSWALEPPRSATAVFNASYLNPFGRVYDAFIADMNTARNRLLSLRARWGDLDSGFAVTCNNIPEKLVLDESLTTDRDLDRVPILRPPITVLKSAIEKINIAIENFEQVCNQPLQGRTASSDLITQSLESLRQASNELSFIDVLLPPITQRNPIS